MNRYAGSWKIDFASFRPIEESGRQVSLHSRNDLLHFDSFPTRPSHGDRLLRIFTNIHPDRARVWHTTDHFEALAGQFADRIGLHRKPNALETWKNLTTRAAASLGLPVVDRPPYDRFMLKIHHAMKEDAGFQETCRKDRWEFPAGSTWIVFTDSASHACLSGQYALEQTFIIRRASLAAPRRPRSRSSRSWPVIRSHAPPEPACDDSMSGLAGGDPSHAHYLRRDGVPSKGLTRFSPSLRRITVPSNDPRAMKSLQNARPARANVCREVLATWP